jgi:PPP family 3-phenylpropionic acid transporter
MKEKFLGTKYSALHFGYWMDYLVIANFAAVFLIGRGFDAVKIGYVTTASALLSMVLQPVAADIADRSKNITVDRILKLLFGVSFLLALVLVLNKGFWITFLLFMIIYSLVSTISPLLSALCLKYEDQGMKLNFGVARSCGSFGYAICAYIMGNVTEKMGAETILPVFCTISFLMLVTLLCMPGIKPAHHEVHAKKAEHGSSDSVIHFFTKNKKYTLFLLGSMFGYFMQFLFATYMIYFAKSYGGGDSVMGTVLFVTAFAEIPSVAFGMKIMKKLTAERMLRIFSIAGIIKYASLVFITGIKGFIFIHVIHLCYSGFFIVSSVYFANQLVDKTETVKAQAYMGVATTGITAMLANIIGGYMIEYLPIKTILIVGASVSVVGALFIFAATQKD